jgi:hypothetical protein
MMFFSASPCLRGTSKRRPRKYLMICDLGLANRVDARFRALPVLRARAAG